MGRRLSVFKSGGILIAMTQYVWINGKTMPMADAKVGVEDRGYQFADGVYEVIRIYNGRPFTLTEHLQRLERSCEGVRLGKVFDHHTLARQIAQFIQEHGPSEGMVYLQITRGEAPRNHVFPKHWEPTILFYCRPLPAVAAPGTGPGISLHTVADERWHKCWIKSIALLANILAKNEAVDASADEAVFVDDGLITECSTSNLFAIINNQLVTHPVGPKVLPGITRLVLLQIAREIGIPVAERPLHEAEARSASEVFICNTTHELEWVSTWDGKIQSKQCGAVTRQLHEAYCRRVRRDTAAAAPLSLAGT
jgi:D-alanine transaminase